jgi:hypothetical protein
MLSHCPSPLAGDSRLDGTRFRGRCRCAVLALDVEELCLHSSASACGSAAARPIKRALDARSLFPKAATCDRSP